MIVDRGAHSSMKAREAALRVELAAVIKRSDEKVTIARVVFALVFVAFWVQDVEYRRDVDRQQRRAEAAETQLCECRRATSPCVAELQVSR